MHIFYNDPPNWGSKHYTSRSVTGQYQSTDILTRLSSISAALNNPDISMNSQGRFVFFLLFLLNYCCPHWLAPLRPLMWLIESLFINPHNHQFILHFTKKNFSIFSATVFTLPKRTGALRDAHIVRPVSKKLETKITSQQDGSVVSIDPVIQCFITDYSLL